MRRVWDCQIGGDMGDLPWGADLPMRQAIRQAYRELTGKEPEFLFSGWGAKLSPDQEVVAAALGATSRLRERP